MELINQKDQVGKIIELYPKTNLFFKRKCIKIKG